MKKQKSKSSKRVRKSKGAPKIVRTRWEKSADRENERRRAKAPLFVHAGVVPLATPEQRQVQIEGGLRRFEEQRQATVLREEQEAITKREDVRGRVTPEEFAKLEARCQSRDGRVFGGYPSLWFYWTSIIDSLNNAGKPSMHEVDASAGRVLARERDVQTELFAVAPTGVEIALVADGLAVSKAVLAEAHGIDLNREAQPELPPAPPCPDCGWSPSPPGTLAVADMNIHEGCCPSLRALILGLSERCVDCKGRSGLYSTSFWGPCEAHRARTLACAHEGCIPGPSPYSYMDGEFCTRCKINMRAPPYWLPGQPRRAA